MKIYDCFTFYNELDLLEIRLNELNDVVDKFVLVEAEKTHQNKDKELYFENNKIKFAPFLHKIIHIIVPKELFVDNDAWYNEKLQRNCILEGLKETNDDDFLIVSDLDEIPSSESIKQAINFNQTPLSFEHILHYYYLNTPLLVNNSEKNLGSVLLKKSFLKKIQKLLETEKNTVLIL
jgi:beta-1,4-mannosyl-glycoprotein beta-1,4-N-acetylglucosaminyltransferase